MTVMPHKERLRLAVFKFASCDGCQLALLSCEDELLALADRLEIVHFLEASSQPQAGPYDISLIEGSISTPEDVAKIQTIRRQSRRLVTIGACATSGGIQALRNWADKEEYLRSVYAHPEYIETLATSTPIRDHVKVDFELRGCPINKGQLLEVLMAFLHDRQPRTARHSVCLECKRQSTVCVAVAKNLPCIGPITQAGCGAICPAYHRACYGCFGPCQQPNARSLSEHYLATGTASTTMIHQLRNVNAAAPLFQIESDRLERREAEPRNG